MCECRDRSPSSWRTTTDLRHTKSARLKTAYLLQLAPCLSEDEADQLPINVRVGFYELINYTFSMITYVCDMALDVWVAVEHFKYGRMLAFYLTIAFVVVPSLILNFISLCWWLDDQSSLTKEADHSDAASKMLLRQKICNLINIGAESTQRSEMTDSEQVTIDGSQRQNNLKWLAFTVLQIGPLVWHCRALWAAFMCRQLQQLPIRERQLHNHFYLRMIEADRDASVLRFFEALLESLPQLLIQGYFFVDDAVQATKNGVTIDWRLRVFAMAISLLSVSLSFVSHQRTLRLSLPNKKNLNVLECNLILTWRFFSILGRFNFLSLLVYFHMKKAFVLLITHLILSALHISFFQHLKTSTKFSFLDKLMIAINVWIHLFAPFSMSAGRTRERYCIGYGLEVLEASVILIIHYFCAMPSSTILLKQTAVLIWSPVLYLSGLVVMIIYFFFAHPTLAAARTEPVRLSQIRRD